MKAWRFTWLGLVVSIGYWLFESAMHAVVFTPELSFMQALRGENDPNELVMRGIIITLIAAFGFAMDRHSQRQQRLLAKTQRLNRLLTFLSKVNQHVQRRRDPQELFAAACAAAVQTGGFRLAWIGLREDGGLHLRAWATADPRLDAIIQPMKKPMKLCRCLGVQSVLQSGEQVVYALRDKVECEAPWKAAALELGCKQVAAMPLKCSDQTVGVFEVYAGADGSFGEDELTILNEVADDISHALAAIGQKKRRKAYEEQLEARLEELERFHKVAVGREFRIKELRDEVVALKAEIKSLKGGAMP